MNHASVSALLVWTLLVPLSATAASAANAHRVPELDQRAAPETLNTLRTFPTIESKESWQARARQIREHILVSCGLWPLPARTPLQAQISGKVERDGYTVENVAIQTYPGFYLCGNLYRPLKQGTGRSPGVLNPHGHWNRGRLEDSAGGSIAARCIHQARMGMIAFSYDMVGYNDTAQVSHRFALQPTNLLWNVNLMGLQTWNSLRALDFLAALPDVDTNRLACTGESGGGTQTFMLGAIDDRLAAQAPIVMVSHSMQGGCQCENAPGLRLDYSNMEIAACPAPRPQILVAATGDWTKATLEIEGPAIEKIYALMGARDHLRSVRFDFDHNYNQTSREAVYGWFGRWLLNDTDPAKAKEQAYQKEKDEQLRVWKDGQRPADALDEPALIRFLVQQAQQHWQAIQPREASGIDRFKEQMMPLWRHTLQLDTPDRGVLVEAGAIRTTNGLTFTQLHLGRAGRGDRVPALMITPRRDTLRFLSLLVHPGGQSGYLDEFEMPTGLAKKLIDRQQSIILLDTFLTGSSTNDAALPKRSLFENFFTTYNRTDLQERVQDIATLTAFAQVHGKGRRVILCGQGRAGLWVLAAAPVVDAVVADCAAIDLNNDTLLLESDLLVPGLRRIGSFPGAASLAVPHPLLLHNVGAGFDTAQLQNVYQAAKATTVLRTSSEKMNDEAVADWIAAQTKGNFRF